MLTQFLGLEIWAWILIVPVFLIVLLALVAFGIRIVKIIKERKAFKEVTNNEE